MTHAQNGKDGNFAAEVRWEFAILEALERNPLLALLIAFSLFMQEPPPSIYLQQVLAIDDQRRMVGIKRARGRGERLPGLSAASAPATTGFPSWVERSRISYVATQAPPSSKSNV